MDMYNLILVAQPSNGADAWTVEVEISSDHPVADEPGINDIDSNRMQYTTMIRWVSNT
ncbi:MAG: hypothetical protein IPH98_05780 [Saprospiraceae bacterium]|nr:hypothetical protein [Candidatus Defluviibacterium haderslevense]